MSQDYQNYFVWITKFGDLIEKIEQDNNILFSDENYQQILKNLNQYLQIDDVIFNTEVHPFLFNVVNAAANMPTKDFNIVFAEIFTPENINIQLDKEDFLYIKQNIHQGLKDFFHYTEKELDSALSKKYTDFNHNLHFIDYEDIAKQAIEKFKNFNINQIHINEITKKFTELIHRFTQDPEGEFNISYKMDLIKPLIGAAGHFTEKNILQTDFDQLAYFDTKFEDDNIDFPKFSLYKLHGTGNKPLSTSCYGGINYYPQAAEKIFMIFFENTIENFYDQLQATKTFMIPEKRYEILFEYLSEKNFKSNEEIKNFFENTEYQELKQDFNRFYLEYINQPLSTILPNFMKAHFYSKTGHNFHIFNDQEIVHIESKEDYIGKNASTWRENTNKFNQSNIKNNIFEQI